MLFINCKVWLKHGWKKHCVLSMLSNVNDSVNADSNNILFTIKDTKLYVTVVTLTTKGNQKLSKLLSKGFERSVSWNAWNKKVRIKIQQTSIDIFLNQIF